MLTMCRVTGGYSYAAYLLIYQILNFNEPVRVIRERGYKDGAPSCNFRSLFTPTCELMIQLLPNLFVLTAFMFNIMDLLDVFKSKVHPKLLHSFA